MPIKKDEKGNRSVEMAFVAPGTPEQVWQAMATGPGNTAWFTRATIDERAGGKLRFTFDGGVASDGEVTTWDPPRRFGYVERDWSEGAPPVATEITITARSGGTCLVRMVHSLYATSDDWDDQLEGFESGWPGFFEVLRIYLAHAAGTPAASCMAMVTSADDELRTWIRLTQALALENANVRERRTTAFHPQPLTGVVERVQQDTRQRFVILRLEAPAPGAAILGTHHSGGKTAISVGLYFYGNTAEDLAGHSELLWRPWLNRTFGTPA